MAMISPAPAAAAPRMADRPTPAQPEDRDLRAGHHPRGVEYGTRAGEHGAGKQRRDVWGQVSFDLHQRLARKNGMGGKGGNPDVVIYRRAVHRQPAVSGHQLADAMVLRRAGAKRGPSFGAGRQLPHPGAKMQTT